MEISEMLKIEPVGAEGRIRKARWTFAGEAASSVWAEEQLRQLKDTCSEVCAFWKIEIMAGPETDAQYQFTGIKKYFNCYTLTGRMNCVLATYGGIALIVIYFKLRSKKTPAVKAT